MGSDVQQYLIRWGKSRAINDPYHLDYPHETPFSRLSKSGGWAVKLSALDDETHGHVDRVVSQLASVDEYRHAVIVMSYVHCCSDAVIARALSKETQTRHTRHHVRDMRHRAEGWIESRLGG
ncbi:antiterminator Q family protein [Haliea salexigens]|uniref:antiterminator Q family protein n=1 Tax=Haliea salexigens TaxID=287487 RepID=UPI003B846387